MGLKDHRDFIRFNLTTVIEGIEGVCKRFRALSTLEPLTPFARSTVVMRYRVVTEGAVHGWFSTLTVPFT